MPIIPNEVYESIFYEDRMWNILKDAEKYKFAKSKDPPINFVTINKIR